MSTEFPESLAELSRKYPLKTSKPSVYTFDELKEKSPGLYELIIKEANEKGEEPEQIWNKMTRTFNLPKTIRTEI